MVRVAGLLVALAVGAAGHEAPCDILVAAGNPCVAAHSTTRALYAAYAGALYTVRHTVSNRTVDIFPVAPGGFADAAAHQRVCPAVGDCVISRVADQSGHGNNLEPRDDRGCPGYHPGQFGKLHNPVDASRLKVHVQADTGRPVEVYGMYFDPGMGYKNNRTTGIATGDEEETIFAVMAGTRWSNRCCFDYGNSELGGYSNGAGTMEAIFFGNSRWRGNQGYAEPGCTLAPPMEKNITTNLTICDGASPQTSANCCGPWLGADLESGMYYGGGEWGNVNERNKPLRSDFVSLMLKGRHDGFVLKGGDATRGPLDVKYDGPRPTAGNYTPMRKEGAIILGTGGDQSNGNRGNFYEGYMVKGATTDATDDAVQASIVAAGYSVPPPLRCAEVDKSVCYYDSPHARIMGDVVVASSGMTRELCMEACFGRQKRLAGVENGRQCMCGDAVDARAVSSANCTTACPGRFSERCGGYMAIDVLNFTCGA